MTEKDKDQIIRDLEAQIETLKTVIWKMPGNVFWRDAEGVYLGCNQNNATLIGLSSPNDIVGKTLTELMDPISAARIEKTDSEVMKSGKEVCTEELVFNRKGEQVYYLANKSPIFNKEGKLIGLLGVSLNIMEHKRTEQLLHSAKKKAEAISREKSQFLSMISHELRTPLTSILGFIRFLENDTLSVQQKKECLKHITTSGSYLLSLVNNILDYNKLEAKKTTLMLSSFNLREVAEEVLSILHGAAQSKSLRLQLEYNVTTSLFISDKNAIKQILVNLISNAIKFTEKGHVLLRIEEIKSMDKKFSRIKISVEDTGAGIPANQLTSIFKRFHQLDNAYSRNTSLTGTGLGLAIVKKLIRLLNSKIEVRSVLQQGSIFSFILNLEKDNLIDTDKTSLHPQTLTPTATLNHKHKILLIEDDHLIQIIHRRMLEDLDYDVEIAENARVALDKLSNDFDLLFMDIGLPDINGLDLIKIIREKGYELPIIALTGFSEEDEQKLFLKAGANKVIIKPVSQIKLETLLQEYI